MIIALIIIFTILAIILIVRIKNGNNNDNNINLVQDGGQKGCSVNFVSVTSLKVGISPQNF